MNIVYAVKIFAAMMILLGVMRLVAGKGLREVMTPADWKAAWPAVAITLFVSCFSWKQPLFFVFLSLWACFAPRLFGKAGEGRLPAYALLMCVSPQFAMEIQDIGPLKDVMHIDAYRVVEIFILIPEAVRLLARRERPPSPSWLTLSDLATAVYLLYVTTKLYGQMNMSSIARESLGVVLDSALPYYVLSRACVIADMRRRILSMLLFGTVYECTVGIVEGLSRHLLYAQLQYLYGIRWSLAGALTRGDFVRAQAGLSGALILAVLALFGIGLWFVLKPTTKSRPYAVIGLTLLGGMLVTFSRGPLLVAMVLVVAIFLLRHMQARKFLLLTLVALGIVAAAWSHGLGDLVIAAIDSVSGGDKTANFNVLYRQELLKTSLALIQQSPWWGVPNYLAYMQDLRQGEGIIDLVNTYLIVTLNTGAVGLVLFLMPFVVVLLRLSASIPEEPSALRRERIGWIALTLAIMAVVFTTSPVSVVHPILVWTVAIALGGLQEGLLPRRRTRLGVRRGDVRPVSS